MGGMCASPGGGINGGIGFPISPGLMGATNHPSTPSCTSIGGQRKRRYAVRGAAPPPHCFLVRGVCGTEKRRYAVGGTAPPPHCFSVVLLVDREEAPLRRGKDCPPTALLLTCGVLWKDLS